MTSESHLLLIRADAGPRHGFGHVMRCLALTQAAMAAGCRIVWVSAECPVSARTRLSGEGLAPVILDATPGSPEDAIATAAVAERVGADWIVLDGYHFDLDYQDRLTASGRPVLYLDDNGIFPRYPANRVLNQNPYAAAAMYHGHQDESLLLGPPFLLLRREFCTPQARQRCRKEPTEPRRILVTFGGCDGSRWTGRTLAALSEIRDPILHVTVVIGSGNPCREAISAAAAASPHTVILMDNPPDMAVLMRNADLAVAAAGTTTWELAAMGVPALVFPVADNQRHIAETLHVLGVAQSLGWHETVKETEVADAVAALLADSPRRSAMATAGRSLVDGHGAERVVRELGGNVGKPELRPATLADLTALWNLANQPEVRQNSFSPDPIPFASHVRWFAARLANPASRIHVLERNGRLLGQIRHDRQADGDSAEIDIAVGNMGRGQGLGRRLLTETAALVCRELAVSALHATVFVGNLPSMELFRRCGFSETGTDIRDGREIVHFIWQPTLS